MPYIPASCREKALSAPISGGELCYALTRFAKAYLEGHDESYKTYGEIRHALATAWDEYFLPRFQRYEAMKREQNGDV